MSSLPRRAPLRRLVLLGAVSCLVAASVGAARPTAGAVTITGGPSGETTETSATFTFDLGRAAEPSLTQCALDGSGGRCSSPQSYSGLALGRHVFTVLAFDTNGNQVGNDERIWTIVAPPPPDPGPGPGPGPEPPPAGFAAKLGAAQNASPGGLVPLDASGSTGEIATFQFDLDGNGSFETKCGANAMAGAVYTEAGSYEVGVMAVSKAGETSTAKAFVAVGGPAAPPPAGSQKLPPGMVVGGCAEPGSTPGTILVLFHSCPKTVVLGVAEAVARSGCFLRTLVSKPEPRELFVGKAGFGAFVNGLRVNPASGSSITLDATIKRIYLGGNSASKARLWIYRESPSLSIETAEQGLDWNVATASTVGTF